MAVRTLTVFKTTWPRRVNPAMPWDFRYSQALALFKNRPQPLMLACHTAQSRPLSHSGLPFVKS